MRMFMDPQFEMMMRHLEQTLSRPGKQKAASLQEARHILTRMFENIVAGPFSLRPMGMEMHESIRALHHRIERAHTADDIRELVRDLRQYAMTASTMLQTRSMDERIRDLEGQIKSMSETSVTPSSESDEKVITLEKLKDKKVLFAVMPFHEDFYDVWVGGVQRAATGTGLTPVRIDMITKSSEVTDDIVSVIEMAEVVVVDVTRNNPNVMFELGFTLAKNRPHIVISQSTEFLTFDIKNVRTVIYRNCWKGIEDLHKELQKFIKGTIGDKGKKK